MPSVTIWNRIEPRCRNASLQPGLQARAHDPLWLLARQWQVGEFAGRDTGSPVSVEVQSTSVPLDRFAIGSESWQPYDNHQPIEVLIEREAVRPTKATDDLRQATEAGLHFLRLLTAANLAQLGHSYLTQYPLTQQNNSDADTTNFSQIVSGRVIDGIKLYADLTHTGDSLPPLPAIDIENHDAVLDVTRKWVVWYASMFSEPGSTNAWSADRMEYQFSVGPSTDSSSFTAREYDGGNVDWYTFDRSSNTATGTPPQPVKNIKKALVSPVTFRGMPARRFWEMENARVDIGALSAGAEDLGRLLLREFALIYGNDWFQVPLAVPVGSDVTIDYLIVVDTFGLKTTIPHYSQVDGTQGSWRMFALSGEVESAESGSAQHLVILPNAVGTLESAAIEDVLLLRDELADMTWGVEKTVLGASGISLDREEVWKRNTPPASPPTANGVPKYRLGSTVPDYWIPLIPVGLENGQLRLRRGILPTSNGNPLGKILAYPDLTMFLEEVPREGVHLQRRYRYARGLDGSTSVWIGRRRYVGGGEGRSGLRFDYLEF